MTDREFGRIVEYMHAKTGINLSEKRILVKGRLEQYLRENQYQSIHDFMDLVERNPRGRETEFLLHALTTNHTFFWREYEQFLYLKRVVLPELRIREEGSKDLRIWCAASSTGEEPYTLAMICKDYLGLEHTLWDTRILATDIDTHVLEQAIRGVYARESVEQLPEGYVRRFFRLCNDEEYEVKQELKAEVIFRQFNLMNPLPFKKKLHVVFIRNVMIYFDDKTKEALLDRIYDKMAPGGYLFIGSTEALNHSQCKFQYIQPSVYRKL